MELERHVGEGEEEDQEEPVAKHIGSGKGHGSSQDHNEEAGDVSRV